MPFQERFWALNRRVQGASRTLNRINEWLCAGLVGVMVLIVWLGVLSRYVVDFGVTWGEELSRYVMIWAALLALPVGVYYREHIGFELIFKWLSPRVRRGLRIVLDLVAIGFFSVMAYYGVGMTAEGANQYATIFGMTMLVPFASVPVSTGLAAFQTVAVLMRDLIDAEGESPGASTIADAGQPHGGAA